MDILDDPFELNTNRLDSTGLGRRGSHKDQIATRLRCGNVSGAAVVGVINLTWPLGELALETGGLRGKCVFWSKKTPECVGFVLKGTTKPSRKMKDPAVTKECLIEVRGAQYPLTWGLNTTPL